PRCSPLSPPQTYTLSLHDALPIYELLAGQAGVMEVQGLLVIRIVSSSRYASLGCHPLARSKVSEHTALVIRLDSTDDFSRGDHLDRKSTRLNSSHEWISYAVFCLK